MIEIQEIDDVTLVFPAGITHLLPEMKDIPMSFRGNRWRDLASRWFFNGLEGVSFTPKVGVDPEKALRHVGACLGCYEFEHNHKMAGCAFLLSEWFETFVYPDKAVSPLEFDPAMGTLSLSQKYRL